MERKPRSADEVLAQGLQDAANASEEPLNQIRSGAQVIFSYLAGKISEVALEQDRIREKIDDGSRLTKHRFNTRFPLR
jgi:hypothetical protein